LRLPKGRIVVLDRAALTDGRATGRAAPRQ